MIAGDNIAGRYEIEESIGSGGMGAIYRARDLETGMRVAIKVLLGEGWESRLEMEARVLAELRHPRIVRYVGHGVTAEGSPFLAMQWLEGEDLAKRMDAGGGLSAQESIHVAINVAEALAAGHARGVLHRDVKPSNVFLREGEVDHLVLIDYGLARRTQGGRRLTQTGSVLGTPEYMAPEQAKGERDIDARVDVYALGCVLFECLTGRTPFAAEHAIAVLGKVLLETAPRLRSLRPEMPEELDELIARMLSKNRDERPRDGEDALSLLRGLAPVHASPVRPASIPPLSITHGEQRLMSVIFARPTTWLDEPLLDRLHQLVVEEGDALQALADGSILVALPGKGTATDQAARASRVAIELRAAISSTVALATGRGVLAHGWPVGEALDRAAAMLGQVESSGLVLDAPVVDKLTAALLDSRYTVRNEGPFTVLERGERSAAGRTVLGRETPFVGRERVMRDLAATIEGCLRDETSGVVVVTAAPGVGKSRLLRELAASLRSSHPELAVWFAHGEAAHAGSPFDLLAPTIHALASVGEGADESARLRARVGRHVPPTEVDRIATFLGEMAGLRPADDSNVLLRAARADAMLMGDQTTRAFVELVTAECKDRPLLLVIDDLQWGDQPSIGAIDAALRALSERPFVVIGCARPEVHDVFPRLWATRSPTVIALPDLARKHACKLVRAVLGESTSDERVEALVDRAAGNAFFLEELIRAASEGEEQLPTTVLALVQGRFDALSLEARRILRAAAVFGLTFWEGGLRALLGGDRRTSQLGVSMRELVEREVIERAAVSRFPDESEWSFRHTLLRDGAYATLTEEDRRLGHALCASWLERMGERDALVIATHFELGSDLERAAHWYTRAAEQSLGVCDLHAAILRAERAVTSGAEGETLGHARRVQAEAHRWRGEPAAELAAAREALAHFRAGTPAWCHALGELAAAARGDTELLLHCGTILADLEGPLGNELVIAWARAGVVLLFAGEQALAARLMNRIEEAVRAVPLELTAQARVHVARAFRSSFAGDAGGCRDAYAQAVAIYRELGDVRNTCMQLVNLGYSECEIGDDAAAEASLRAAHEQGIRLGIAGAAASAWSNLGPLLLRTGRIDEAVAIETEAIEVFVAQRDPRLEGSSRNFLAGILAAKGDLDEALRQAERSIERLANHPANRTYALAMRASVHLKRGESDQAMYWAQQSWDTLTSIGSIEEGDAFVRLTYAEALHSVGRTADAKTAILAARDRLRARAARMSDLTVRESFLGRVPDNVRTLELANAWGR